MVAKNKNPVIIKATIAAWRHFVDASCAYNNSSCEHSGTGTIGVLVGGFGVPAVPDDDDVIVANDISVVVSNTGVIVDVNEASVVVVGSTKNKNKYIFFNIINSCKPGGISLNCIVSDSKPLLNAVNVTLYCTPMWTIHLTNMFRMIWRFSNVASDDGQYTCILSTVFSGGVHSIITERVPFTIGE